MTGKKPFKRIYIEITNKCNLNCSFCPKTNRPLKIMNAAELETIIKKIDNYADYLYFHVMGEPLLNKNIDKFLNICEEYNKKVNLVTNGILLDESIDKLQSKALRKVTVSLHALEANNFINFDIILDKIIKNIQILSKNAIIELRLWNEKSDLSKYNEKIFKKLENIFNVDVDRNLLSQRISENIFLERANRFIWPSDENEFYDKNGSCLALSQQVAILVNGDVVPCCLDSEGSMKLGNIFKNDFNEIINSSRATCILDGFKTNNKVEETCRRCRFRNR